MTIVRKKKKTRAGGKRKVSRIARRLRGKGRLKGKGRLRRRGALRRRRGEVQQPAAPSSVSYNQAYDAGFDEAYNEGFNIGYAEGMEAGHQEAYKGA